MICCHKEYKNIIFAHLTLPRDPSLCVIENVKRPNLKKYNFQTISPKPKKVIYRK